MPRVSIRYQNGSTVEANNLGDALVHVMSNGVDYVEDIVEDIPNEVCSHCEGSGVHITEGDLVLTRKQIEEKVEAINEAAPPTSGFDARVKAARSLAKD